MDLDDLFDPKVGIAVAVTAAVTSKPVRQAIRRGAVYGVAGVLIAADRLNKLGQAVSQEAQKAAGSAAEAAQDVRERGQELAAAGTDPGGGGS